MTTDQETLQLFNSQTQQLESVQVLDNKITIYICNNHPPNGRISLETAFAYCTADIVVRYLKMNAQAVNYGLVPNEDTGDALSTEPFANEMQRLNVHLPDFVQPQPDPIPAKAERQAAACIWLFKQERPQIRKAKGITIDALLQRYPPAVLRIYFAQYHYRQTWTFNEISLVKATQHIEKLKAALTAVSSGSKLLNLTPTQKRFQATMNNDLDTGKTIATLLNLADEILFRAPHGYQINDAQALLRRLASVFGLQLADLVEDPPGVIIKEDKNT